MFVFCQRSMEACSQYLILKSKLAKTICRKNLTNGTLVGLIWSMPLMTFLTYIPGREKYQCSAQWHNNSFYTSKSNPGGGGGDCPRVCLSFVHYKHCHSLPFQLNHFLYKFHCFSVAQCLNPSEDIWLIKVVWLT